MPAPPAGDFHFSFSSPCSATRASAIEAHRVHLTRAGRRAAGRGGRRPRHQVPRAHIRAARRAHQILMWEVPGAPRYLDAAPRYASMAAGLLLVFDLTRRSTLERIPTWLEAVEAASPDLPRVLVGNKSDGETVVSAEEAVALAQKHGCKYFETSAIRNDQVPEAFSSLIARIVAQIPNPPEPSLLLKKRIQIGKSLAENKSFRAALFDMAA